MHKQIVYTYIAYIYIYLSIYTQKKQHLYIYIYTAYILIYILNVKNVRKHDTIKIIKTKKIMFDFIYELHFVKFNFKPRQTFENEQN